MGQNPCLPVHRGEIQARNLGMAVEVWSEEGTASRGDPRARGLGGTRMHARSLGVASPGPLCLRGAAPVTCRLTSFQPGLTATRLPVPSPRQPAPLRVGWAGQASSCTPASRPRQPDAPTWTRPPGGSRDRLLLCSQQWPLAINQQSPSVPSATQGPVQVHRLAGQSRLHAAAII